MVDISSKNLKRLSDEEKVELLKNENDKFARVRIIMSFENDKYRKAYFNELNFSRQVTLTKKINDVNFKLQFLEKIDKENDDDRAKIIQSLPDDDTKITFLYTLNYPDNKFLVIKSIKDDEKKEKLIKEVPELFKDEVYDKSNGIFDQLEILYYQFEILNSIESDSKRLELMNIFQIDEVEMYSFEIICGIKDENLRIKKLKEKGFLDKYRIEKATFKFIEDHLKEFIESSNIDISLEKVLQMKEKNKYILKSDFRLLDNKFVDSLGMDIINQISCYSNIKDATLELSEKELKIIKKCIKNFQEVNKTDEWNILYQKLLENIKSYSKLIENIDLNDYIDYQLLTSALILPNELKISTKKELDNYYDLKNKKCNMLIKSKYLEDKKTAVLYKMFGQGLEESKRIVRLYKDTIKNKELWCYLEALNSIINLDNSELLDLIYKNCEPVKNINIIGMERLLKKEYAKEFNKGLLRIEDLQYLGDNLYDAGTDFRIIIHSIGAYYRDESSFFKTNYKEDWNRPDISSQFFSASYIRNDMLNMAPVYDICYGFIDMAEDSLVLSGIRDTDIRPKTFTPEFLQGKERYIQYRMPDEHIDNTVVYNELDYRRFQNGKKKQPDYIIIFKKNGKMNNYESAQKASKDFGGLPIVVIDIDKCLQSERNKVEKMLKDFKNNPSIDLAQNILIKVRNNRLTNENFCCDIDFDKINDYYEKYKDKKSKIIHSNNLYNDDKSELSNNIRKIKRIIGDDDFGR